MLHGVMLGPVMFSCLFGGARHGLYITLSKVSHKTANGTIHYPSCHLFYPVLNPFSFSYGYFAVMSEKKKLSREALVYILVFDQGGGGGLMVCLHLVQYEGICMLRLLV